jgi:ABC-type dipeptide/oligopeptide/nickel transport system permease component
MRSSIIQTRGEDYLQTARAKGLVVSVLTATHFRMRCSRPFPWSEST